MTEDMEDQSSWNEMVFRQIRARKEWLVDLIWRKQLEHESDTNDVEIEDQEVMNNHGDDQDNPSFTTWCDERRENFNAARVDHASVARRPNYARDDHTAGIETTNSVGEDHTSDNVPRGDHTSVTMRLSSTREDRTSEVVQINSAETDRTSDNVTREDHISGTTKPGRSNKLRQGKPHP